jgi:hypothetical protein
MLRATLGADQGGAQAEQGSIAAGVSPLATPIPPTGSRPSLWG